MFPGPVSSKAERVFTIDTQTNTHVLYIHIYAHTCIHAASHIGENKQKTTLTQTQVIPAASSYSTLADQDESPLAENTYVIRIPLVRVSPDTPSHGVMALPGQSPEELHFSE